MSKYYLLLLCFFSFAANADDSNPFLELNSKRLVLAYTDGNGYGGGMGECSSQAIMFPAERMERLKGNQITHVRFFVWPGEYTNMKLWIGTALDKRDIIVQNITDYHDEGWTEVALEQPYTITGDSIFVGVDIDNPSAGSLLKWDAYAENDVGCFFYRWGKWDTDEGTWFLQCMVEGETIPQNDIHIIGLAGLTYKSAIKLGDVYECTLKLRNWGSMPIEKYEMQALLDGIEAECSTRWDQPIVRGAGSQEIRLLVTPSKGTIIGNHKLTIKPKSLNCEAYEYSKVPKEVTMKVYEHDMGRQKVLVQVYAGQGCGYCPQFDEVVEQKMKERDDLVLVSIHSSTYSIEAFCCEANDCYMSMLYTGGIPNVDLNRSIEQTLYNFRTDRMENELDVAKAQPSFANVNIISSYNENNNTVDITVSGERNEDFVPCEEWTNLTVLLVEDNVLGYQNNSELSPYYPHKGVIRSNVSAIWGDLVEWNGDKYEMHYSATLNHAWNKDNLRIVAFLSKPFTGANYDEINVVNCNELYLKDEQTGIQEMSHERIYSSVYDLKGCKIRSNSLSLKDLPKGIYIVNGKKFVNK